MSSRCNCSFESSVSIPKENRSRYSSAVLNFGGSSRLAVEISILFQCLIFAKYKSFATCHYNPVNNHSCHIRVYKIFESIAYYIYNISFDLTTSIIIYLHVKAKVALITDYNKAIHKHQMS